MRLVGKFFQSLVSPTFGYLQLLIQVQYFVKASNSQLFNTCDNNSITRPSNFIIKAEKEQLISGLKLSLATSLILPEATPTATLQLLRNNKVIYEITMLYGREMRATEDPRPIFKRVKPNGIFFYKPLSKSIKLSSSHFIQLRVLQLKRSNGLIDQERQYNLNRINKKRGTHELYPFTIIKPCLLPTWILNDILILINFPLWNWPQLVS